MEQESLKYFSAEVASNLQASIDSNIGRYVDGDFSDLCSDIGWNIELNKAADLSELANLNPGVSGKRANADFESSIVVWKALHSLSPALAAEERFWVRLCHLNQACFEYGRARWLVGKSGEGLIKSVKKHYFCNGITGYRDDNAVSRLWWTAKIAKELWPHDQAGAVKLIFTTEDIRQAFIERRWSGSRLALGAGILRGMTRNKVLISKEQNFRDFMIIVNRLGAAPAFEVMSEREIDSFIDECCYDIES